MANEGERLRFGSFEYDPSDPASANEYVTRLENDLKGKSDELARRDAAAAGDLSRRMKRVSIKVPLPPSFTGDLVDGKSVSVNSWRQDVWEYLVQQQCPKETRVQTAKRFLAGHARNAYQSYESLAKQNALAQGKAVNVNSWVFFRDALSTLFGHLDEEQVARDNLNSLVQTGSCEQYLREFQSYVAQIKKLPLSEGDLMDRFKRGLKPSLKAQVLLNPATGRPWDSFSEFSHYACRVDGQMMQDSSSLSLNALASQDRPQQQVANGRGKRGAQVPLESVLENLDSFVKVAALFSNKKFKGKSSKNWKNGKGNGKFRKPKAKNSHDGPSKAKCWKDRLCFKCEQPGHIAANCPNRNMVSN